MPLGGPAGWFLDVLSQRSTWDGTTILVVACCCTISAVALWRKPTTLTFVRAVLATLSALLVITPWFYPWYILWLIGPAIVCLPSTANRWVRALIAFVLVFSLSAFLTYFFSGEIALGSAWEQFFSKRIPIALADIGFACINTLVPPTLTFLIVAFVAKPLMLIQKRPGRKVA